MSDLDDDRSGVEDSDPFGPKNVAKVQLIVLMRIYDVLHGILATGNEELSNIILATHDAGKVMGPLPWLDLTEEAGTDDQS